MDNLSSNSGLKDQSLMTDVFDVSQKKLSKSKILAHRQCPKKLWLQINRPDLIQISLATQARYDEGNKVGCVARKNHSPGVFIDTPNKMTAITITKKAIAENQSVFEAAFYEDDVFISADLLVSDGGGYRLTEVKSSTGLKNYYVDDVAIQVWVIQRAGYALSSIALAYINNQFVYQGNNDYQNFFSEVDLTKKVRRLVSQVPNWIDAAKKTLASSEMPQIRPGEQCAKPFVCDFINFCSPPETDVEYPVEILPYGKMHASKLREEGYRDLRQVPIGRLTNPKHIKVHAATCSGISILDVEAVDQIKALGFPRYYLDFETIAFAVPIWAKTRPYMQLPFQWSCHIESADGSVVHKEFLDVSGNDPRKSFVKSLIKAVGNSGPVIVYNASFEGARINELAEVFPSMSSNLLAIADRFFDLLPLARNHYYHPKMKGSWSIKDLLPTVVPELDYSRLEVSDGSMAQDAYREAISTETKLDRKDQIKKSMLKYCEQDTFAMLKIVQAWSS